MIIGIMLEENAYLTLNHVDNLVDELLSSIPFSRDYYSEL